MKKMIVMKIIMKNQNNNENINDNNQMKVVMKKNEIVMCDNKWRNSNDNEMIIMKENT